MERVLVERAKALVDWISGTPDRTKKEVNKTLNHGIEKTAEFFTGSAFHNKREPGEIKHTIAGKAVEFLAPETYGARNDGRLFMHET